VKVSRQHGRIWFENDAWWIEDRNSSRGTSGSPTP
jgi:pSer/pThr/pTyr-binding forkhead associated (FHA) protein